MHNCVACAMNYALMQQHNSKKGCWVTFDSLLLIQGQICTASEALDSLCVCPILFSFICFHLEVDESS